MKTKKEIEVMTIKDFRNMCQKKDIRLGDRSIHAVLDIVIEKLTNRNN